MLSHDPKNKNYLKTDNLFKQPLFKLKTFEQTYNIGFFSRPLCNMKYTFNKFSDSELFSHQIIHQCSCLYHLSLTGVIIPKNFSLEKYFSVKGSTGFYCE